MGILGFGLSPLIWGENAGPAPSHCSPGLRTPLKGLKAKGARVLGSSVDPALLRGERGEREMWLPDVWGERRVGNLKLGHARKVMYRQSGCLCLEGLLILPKEKAKARKQTEPYPWELGEEAQAPPCLGHQGSGF